MKRMLCVLAALTCIISVTACGSSSSSSESVTTQATTQAVTTGATPTKTAPATTEGATTEATTISTTEEVTEEVKTSAPETSAEFVEIIGKDLEITKITTMAAEMIGAEEGTSFRYNDNKFEIYRFKSGDPKIEQAKSGSMTYTIEGFGELTSKSSVNGDFVMIYDTPEDEVIQAFTSI